MHATAPSTTGTDPLLRRRLQPRDTRREQLAARLGLPLHPAPPPGIVTRRPPKQ